MTSRRPIVVVAVDAEAEAIQAAVPDLDDRAHLVVSGLGRTNAACATVQAILELQRDHVAAVINLGIAGALPGSELSIGDVVVAEASVYAEEGIVTPDGWSDTSTGLGFDLGPFPGNTMGNDPILCANCADLGRVGRIATVATCSGTDEHAALIAQRTNALAEAMEGAAVIHAASRLDVPAIELRVISNTTGNRSAQQWDIGRAFTTLGTLAGDVLDRFRSSDG